jgi:hypothetical protein
MLKKSIITIAAVLAATFSVPASAQSIGDTVTCSITGIGTFGCANATAVVGAGTEFRIGNAPSYSFLGADFGQNLLYIDALADSTLGNTILNFSDATSPFTSYLLLSSSGFAGFDASDISLVGGVLSLDLRGTTNTQGGRIALQLNGAVPEPATWAMMLLGFGAIGMVARRRRTQALSKIA